MPVPSAPPQPYDASTGVTLAPGLRVVRRGTDRLQVGLEPERRVVLARDRTTAEVLDALRDGDPLPASPSARRVVQSLHDGGCLRVARAGEEPAAVAVLDDLAGDPDDPVDTAALLWGAGLRTTGWSGDAGVVLLRTRGDCDRARLDPLVRTGTPHLLLRLVDGDAVLGPFVSPGLTCCLRCIDAHRALEDPDHHVVTDRYLRAGASPRGDGVPDLADAALVVTATAAAVRELAAYARGEEPASWSRTRRWTRDADAPGVRTWERHPGCGCSWAPDDHVWGTMGP